MKPASCGFLNNINEYNPFTIIRKAKEAKAEKMNKRADMLSAEREAAKIKEEEEQATKKMLEDYEDTMNNTLASIAEEEERRKTVAHKMKVQEQQMKNAAKQGREAKAQAEAKAKAQADVDKLAKTKKSVLRWAARAKAANPTAKPTATGSTNLTQGQQELLEAEKKAKKKKNGVGIPQYSMEKDW